MALRVQRKRVKGWRMPDNTIFVGRRTKWGNPFKVGSRYIASNGQYIILDDKKAVSLYAQSILLYWSPVSVADIKKELKGRNLACWCKPGKPCHADFLIEVAN